MLPVILDVVNNATQEALNGAETIHELMSFAALLGTITAAIGILVRTMKKTLRM